MSDLQTPTIEELRLYAARHGLTSLPDDQFARLAELAQTVRATGLAVPRMSSKEDEPAHLFTMTAPRGTK